MTPSGYSDIFAISIHRHGLFFLSQHFEFRYFWGFQKKWLSLGLGDLNGYFVAHCLFFFFFIWGGGGGLFNVKFKLFFIVFFCNFKYLFEKVKISLIGGDSPSYPFKTGELRLYVVPEKKTNQI